MAMTARREREFIPQRPLPENLDLDGTEFEWSSHVLAERCQERHVSPFEVVAAIIDPDRIEPYRNGGPGEMSYYRGDLCVGYIPRTKVIKTVITLNGNKYLRRKPLIPKNRMHLIRPEETKVSAPVKALEPTREACLTDWLTNGTSTDPEWERAFSAFKPEPGTKFTGRSYIDFYLHKLGGKVTENSLRLSLSEGRNKGRLVNSNNDPSLEKGTWMVPKVPKGETGGVVVSMKPKATAEKPKVMEAQAKATGQKVVPMAAAPTGGFGKPTIKEAKKAVRALISQIQETAEEQGVKVFVNDEGSQILVSVRWSEPKS